MVTFTGWLIDHESDEGGVGEIARWWRDQAAVRPRASAPGGVQKFLDDQLKLGKLPGTSDLDAGHVAERGRWRELFADVVRAFQVRDGDPIQAGLANVLGERLARIEGRIDLVFRRQEAIIGALGLPVIDAPVAGVPLATAEAAAELAMRSAQRLAERLGAPGADDGTPEPSAAVSGPSRPMPAATAISGDGTAMPLAAGWERMFEVADHAGAATAEIGDAA